MVICVAQYYTYHHSEPIVTSIWYQMSSLVLENYMNNSAHITRKETSRRRRAVIGIAIGSSLGGARCRLSVVAVQRLQLSRSVPSPPLMNGKTKTIFKPHAFVVTRVGFCLLLCDFFSLILEYNTVSCKWRA